MTGISLPSLITVPRIDSYYATTRHAMAWLLARDGVAPTTHRGLLNAIAAQVTGSRLYPAPWNLCCTALTPQAAYSGFSIPPGTCSNLAMTADRNDRAAMLLRTTRGRELDKRIEVVKQQKKLTRAPTGERIRQDQQLAATTIFDFAWRMRARSNYGDPAMFYVGSLGHDRSRAYAAAVRTWTSTTMLLFEALIAQRSKSVLEDAALHFISRDHSVLAETLIVPRLQALGMLGSQTPSAKGRSVSLKRTDHYHIGRDGPHC